MYCLYLWNCYSAVALLLSDMQVTMAGVTLGWMMFDRPLPSQRLLGKYEKLQMCITNASGIEGPNKVRLPDAEAGEKPEQDADAWGMMDLDLGPTEVGLQAGKQQFDSNTSLAPMNSHRADDHESARSRRMSWRQRKAKHPRTSFLTGQSTMAEDNFNSPMSNIRFRIVKMNYEQIRLDTVEVTVGISRVSREWSKLWWAWVEAVGGAAICSFGSGGGAGERTSDGSKRFCKGAIFIQVYPYSMIESDWKYLKVIFLHHVRSFSIYVSFLAGRSTGRPAAARDGSLAASD